MHNLFQLGVRDAKFPAANGCHVSNCGVQWAQKIGPFTAQLFERMMADKPHPEMGYRGCLGVIRLAGKYSHSRMEAAAEQALLTGACRYRGIESILKNSLDRQPLSPSSTPPPATPPHDNIRGAEYFE
jgi:hypothetical protein